MTTGAIVLGGRVPGAGAYRVKCPTCASGRGWRCVATRAGTLPAGIVLSRYHDARGERAGVGPWRP